MPYLSKPNSEKKRTISEHERTRKDALSKRLTEEEKAEKRAGRQATQFNQFVSDRISLHRMARDTRHPECAAKEYYPADHMPDVSVVIVFHNEAWTTLLRTVNIGCYEI